MSGSVLQQHTAHGWDAWPSSGPHKRQRASSAVQTCSPSQDDATVRELRATIRKQQQVIILQQQELLAVHQRNQVLLKLVCALGSKLTNVAGEQTTTRSASPSSSPVPSTDSGAAAASNHSHSSSKTATGPAAPKSSNRHRAHARKMPKSSANDTPATRAAAAVASRIKAAQAAAALRSASTPQAVLSPLKAAATVDDDQTVGSSQDWSALDDQAIQQILQDALAQHLPLTGTGPSSAALPTADTQIPNPHQYVTELCQSIEKLPAAADWELQGTSVPAASTPWTAAAAAAQINSSNVHSTFQYQQQQSMYAPYQNYSCNLPAPVADTGSGTLPALRSSYSNTAPTAVQPECVVLFATDSSSNYMQLPVNHVRASVSAKPAAALPLAADEDVMQATADVWPDDLICLGDADCDNLMDLFDRLDGDQCGMVL